MIDKLDVLQKALEQKAKTTIEIRSTNERLWESLSVGQHLAMKHHIDERGTPPSNPYITNSTMKWVSLEDVSALLMKLFSRLKVAEAKKWNVNIEDATSRHFEDVKRRFS